VGVNLMTAERITAHVLIPDAAAVLGSDSRNELGRYGLGKAESCEEPAYWRADTSAGVQRSQPANAITGGARYEGERTSFPTGCA
jgi:hypothetical protein